jgi:hypothetical protein
MGDVALDESLTPVSEASAVVVCLLKMVGSGATGEGFGPPVSWFDQVVAALDFGELSRAAAPSGRQWHRVVSANRK